MAKRIMSALLVILCMAGVLAGCGKPITESDLDRIATYYFDKNLGQGNWEDYTREKDVVVNSKEAFCLTAQALDGENSFTIAISKDGSGVYRYYLESGRSSRIGNSRVSA